jgi:hypothetical protein
MGEKILLVNRDLYDLLKNDPEYRAKQRVVMKGEELFYAGARLVVNEEMTWNEQQMR